MGSLSKKLSKQYLKHEKVREVLEKSQNNESLQMSNLLTSTLHDINGTIEERRKNRNKRKKNNKK
jgi:hypothetical protein